jgi:hypothetical protein
LAFLHDCAKVSPNVNLTGDKIHVVPSQGTELPKAQPRSEGHKHYTLPVGLSRSSDQTVREANRDILATPKTIRRAIQAGLVELAPSMREEVVETGRALEQLDDTDVK